MNHEQPSSEQMLEKAQAGDAYTQGRLAAAYMWGLGIKKDASKAYEWAEKAAAQNDATGQLILARLYERGIILPKDLKKAFDFHLKAAEQGNPYAQCSVGQAYCRGLGTRHDWGAADEWFMKGANNKHALSQANVGLIRLYRIFSKNRTRDTKKEAYLWLNLAWENGCRSPRLWIAKKIAGLLINKKQASAINKLIETMVIKVYAAGLPVGPCPFLGTTGMIGMSGSTNLLSGKTSPKTLSTARTSRSTLLNVLSLSASFSGIGHISLSTFS